MDKVCNKCGVCKPMDIFNKMRKDSPAYRAACKDCEREQQRAYREANRESVLAQKREYARQNQDAEKARRDAWRELYRDREKAQQREYRQANRDKLAEYIKNYAKQNPAKMHAIVMKRRISKKRQTPAWANHRKIEEIYEFAAEFREAGFDVHVDHVVPISGKNVSGLHVETNLRVCLAAHNLRKSNNFSIEV